MAASQPGVMFKKSIRQHTNDSEPGHTINGRLCKRSVGSCATGTSCILLSCSVTAAFFNIGLSSRLLLATLSSSCFLVWARGGMSSQSRVCSLQGKQLYNVPSLPASESSLSSSSLTRPNFSSSSSRLRSS